MNTILQRIDEAKHVVVMAHVNPDADSLGSASAFYTHLLRLHKKVSFFCATKEIEKKLSCIPWFEKIRDSFPSSADLAISFDCADISRLGIEVECDLINIDHHATNTMYATINLVESSVSTTLLLYNFFQENGISVNKKMATAIYAGILDDSSAFLDDTVDGMVFAAVSELIELGADYKLCNNSIVKSMSLGALRLKALMYKNMHLYKEARVAFFCVTLQDLKETGALGKDCESVLEEALYLPSVEISMLLRENSDGSIKGSVRSNSQVDACRVAKYFFGGGHQSRAGFTVQESISLEALKERILKLLDEEM